MAVSLSRQDRLAGLRDGLVAIPQRWREGLRGQDVLAPLQVSLLAKEPSLSEVMYMPGVADIELELPSREGHDTRDVDLS